MFLKDRLRISIDQAKELLTTKEEKEQGIINVYGLEEIERAFGINIGEEDIPPIPFIEKELTRAGELKEKLILRIPDCTLEILQELMTRRADTEAMKNTGGLRFIDDLIQDLYFTQDKTILEWALVSDKPLDNLYNKTAPVQLKLLVDHLENVIYQDQPLPEKYQDGVTRFRKEYPEIIARLTGITIQEFKNKTDQEAENLIYTEINNDTRQELVNWLENQPIAEKLTHTPATWFYDFCLRYQNARTLEQKQLLQEQYQDYTRLFFHRSSSTSLVSCGSLVSNGAELVSWVPDDRDGRLGVSFSRN